MAATKSNALTKAVNLVREFIGAELAGGWMIQLYIDSGGELGIYLTDPYGKEIEYTHGEGAAEKLAEICQRSKLEVKPPGKKCPHCGATLE